MFLVYDAGGTFIKYAIMDIDANIIEKAKVEAPSKQGNKPEDFVRVCGEIYDRYKDKYEIEGIAMDLPGRIDVDNGIVYGGGGFPYLDKYPLGDMLSKRCDDLPVALENDGKSAALAESWKGNAVGMKHAAVIVIGTGIGGGIIIDGKIHRGLDMMAGEFSFDLECISRDMVDNIIPLEEYWYLIDELKAPRCLLTMYSSILALRRIVGEKKNLTRDDFTGEQIMKLAAEGDTDCIEALEDLYFYIAKKICNLYMTIAPEIILMGGGISANQVFMDGVMKYVNKLRRASHIYDALKVDVCKFRNDSNLIGALYNYKQKFGID